MLNISEPKTRYIQWAPGSFQRYSNIMIGILMYGPPGNGKTMIAKAIANEAGFKFYNMSAGALISKFVGDSEKMIISLFAMARLTQPSVKIP